MKIKGRRESVRKRGMRGIANYLPVSFTVTTDDGKRDTLVDTGFKICSVNGFEAKYTDIADVKTESVSKEDDAPDVFANDYAWRVIFTLRNGKQKAFIVPTEEAGIACLMLGRVREKMTGAK